MNGRIALAALIAAFVASPAMAVMTDAGPAPAEAAPPAAAGAPAPAAAPVKPEDQIVCKRVDVSGTRIQLPKKCMTRKDWARMDGPGKEDIESIMRANLTVNHPGGT